MRWTSRGSRARLRRDSMTGGPMVRFGTKWPSITSTWSRSAPAASTRAMASPSAAKSAERMLGAILITPSPYSTGCAPANFARPGNRGLRGGESAEPDGAEPVGAVDMREEPHEAQRVGRHGEPLRGIHAPVPMTTEKGPDDVLVLLGLERARGVDEPPPGLGE